MTTEKFVQPVIPCFDYHYDHWSMLIENFLRSKEFWPVVSIGVQETTTGTALSEPQKTELDSLRLKDLKAKNYLFSAREEDTKIKEEEEGVSILMAYTFKEKVFTSLWYLDTGCSNHMYRQKKIFSELDETSQDTVRFRDNSMISAQGKGMVQVSTNNNFSHTIGDVFYVPALKTNLLSVRQLQEKGYDLNIKGGVCKIQDP
ncbi:uncharacterized protein LOC107852404 [Capsicum annuum]|uniref:uncharacterized protein LOC107852404 n=1 Tax=Capsicum annuum TaxID=4072 RepID=UPI001FB1878C|nr:uncharacterized protein LOC107852404 [Capsicum annuum]